jgi:hypothetical protein
MALRIAGTAYVTVDGNSIPLRGNLTIAFSPVERTMLAGQDGIHGYQELPRVQSIELDMSTMPDSLLEDLDGQVNSTVVVQSANGTIYSLTEAMCTAALDPNLRDGQVRVKWEGVAMEEIGAA